MNFIVSGRGAGKTTKVLELANQAPKPALILVIHRSEVARVQELVAESKVKQVDVLSFDQVELSRKRYKSIFIDNGGDWIQRLVHHLADPSAAATITVTATGNVIPLGPSSKAP